MDISEGKDREADDVYDRSKDEREEEDLLMKMFSAILSHWKVNDLSMPGPTLYHCLKGKSWRKEEGEGEGRIKI